VNSQPVAATCTEDPVNNSQDKPRTGDAPAGGASTTAHVMEAQVSRIIAQSQVRAAVTAAQYLGIRCIGKQYFGNRNKVGALSEPMRATATAICGNGLGQAFTLRLASG